MSLTKGQIHKLKGKLSRVHPDNPKAKRIRIQLGLEAAPEPVVEAAPAVEVAEVVAEEPAAEVKPKPKPKRTYRRRKTTKAKE